ncbi:MAG TPA: hypothetical protein ENJ02_11620, partial [Chloroflexi bacterium]|nr:hypothetical protein [Chloroflexota bacterium]
TTRPPDCPTARLPDHPTTRPPDCLTARLPDHPTTRLPDYPTTLALHRPPPARSRRRRDGVLPAPFRRRVDASQLPRGRLPGRAGCSRRSRHRWDA